MPRIPAYLLHKPTGQARVRLGGKDYYLGKHGTPASQAAYRKAVAEWLASGASPATHASSSAGPAATVCDVLFAFLKHAMRHYRGPDGEITQEVGNLRAALKPVTQLYRTIPAAEFGPLALRAVRDEMVRSGLARTQVNARINRVRRAFKWAASVELIPVSVPQALATVPGLQRGRTASRETDPIGPVAIEAVEAVLPLLSRPAAGLVRIQLLTGMRPGEACAMRGRDLTRGEPTWTYRPASHKTAHRGKDRAIPLGPKAIEVVRKFLKADPDAYLFDPRQAVAEQHAARAAARVYRPAPSELAKHVANPGSGRARKYSRASYRNAIRSACDRAWPHPTIKKKKGKPLSPADAAELLAWRKAHRWHPNQLRHTAATTIRAQFGLEAVQVVLGHARPETTLIYAERDLAKAAEVMRSVG